MGQAAGVKQSAPARWHETAAAQHVNPRTLLQSTLCRHVAPLPVEHPTPQAEPVRGTCRKKTSLLALWAASKSAVCRCMYTCTRWLHSFARRARRCSGVGGARVRHCPPSLRSAGGAAAARQARARPSSVAAVRCDPRIGSSRGSAVHEGDRPLEAGGRFARPWALL